MSEIRVAVIDDWQNVAEVSADWSALRKKASKAASACMSVGSVSQPIRTSLGMHLVALCGRRSASDDIPSREDIERELGNQQLNMLARRYIRDLRNAATIEQRES